MVGLAAVRACPDVPGRGPYRGRQVSGPGREESKEGRHSEFRYGSLTRSVSLPEGAGADNITAKYDKGILEVSVPTPEHAETTSRHITVQRSG